MKTILRWFVAAIAALVPTLASAVFHTFVVDQVYSNATGTIQFVVLREAFSANGQHLFEGQNLRSGQGSNVQSYRIPTNLPSNATANRRVLFATQAFADLGIVTPDYIIPEQFVPRPGGFVDFASVSRLTYANLPDDGVNAIGLNGQPRSNVATNFAGSSGSVTVAQASPNYTALWWNANESGWGLNINHQGSIVFATLFTYESTGQPMWLVMSNGNRQSDGRTFTGDLFRTTGPAFNANPFTPIGPSNVTNVGTMSITFNGTNSATLNYSFTGSPVTKSIVRQEFGSRAANCVGTTNSRAGATNYQDLWWVPTESGWGINVTHQDNTIFATLFTYDATGRGLWLVLPAGVRQGDGSYFGAIYRTTGPAFNANPFTPIGPGNITEVGTMRFTFSNGENGTLAYTVNGAPVTKQIVRQTFASPVPGCS